MAENIKNWVNVCVVKNNKILLLNRQHDDFPGWIPPGGKVEFPESFFEAAIRELKEETGLTALNLKLKGISGFTNTIGNERFVYYDFLCTNFSGDIRASREGEPKWWNLEDIEEIPMQKLKIGCPFTYVKEVLKVLITGMSQKNVLAIIKQFCLIKLF